MQIDLSGMPCEFTFFFGRIDGEFFDRSDDKCYTRRREAFNKKMVCSAFAHSWSKGKSQNSIPCMSCQNAEGENQESEKTFQNRLFN